MITSDVVGLLILMSAPFITLIVGVWLYKYPPKKVNYHIGYRTPRSKKSPEAWREGNRYSSKMLIDMSLILLGISLLLWFLWDHTEENIIRMTLIETVLLLVSMGMLILLTELHLKKMFGNKTE
ncbi:hypothetical protein MsAg5_00980 [Methanosarcinaceae archaeon Ag5]|uniref:SdpI family protein n=1 Tax=Methanolapillus africanus TaxID=3028297 RepID=A0AAE4MHY4_9EURY|nr:hypothetical protein [Methanosarcinaceae archaeon Ag5]